MSEKKARSSRGRLLLAVFVAAVGFRILLRFSGLIDVFYSTADSWQYEEEARSLVQTGTFSEFGVPSMYRTPGYPLLLALVFGLFGNRQVAVVGVQIFLDALTCVMVVDMARRMGLRRAALAIVAVLSVTCLFTSAYTFEMMTETVYTTALTFAIWVWLVPKDVGDGLWTSPQRAFVAGLALGYAVLVRPAMLAPALTFGACATLLLLVRQGRAIRFRILAAPAALATAVLLMIVPWMVRNRIVFEAEYHKPDNQDATLLGFKSPIRNSRHFYVREYNRFLASYEQPYVALRPDTPPVIARYVYPKEEEEVKAAFAKLHRDIVETGTYRPETMGAFEAIKQKRYLAAPRLYVTAPLTLMAKIWVSPRISVLWSGRSGHNSTTLLTLLMTVYSSLYLIGFFGIWWGLRTREKTTGLFLAAMTVGHTIIYALWMPLPQARYAIPMYPLLALGIGALFDHARARFESRGRAAVDLELRDRRADSFA